MNDMFLLQDTGMGEYFARTAALGFIRVIPRSLRGVGGFGGDVEVNFISGTREYISDADWERIKPLVVMSTGKDWQAEALRLSNEVEDLQAYKVWAKAEIALLSEEVEKLRGQLNGSKLIDISQPLVFSQPIPEDALTEAQKAFKEAMREDNATVMFTTQPADTPPPARLEDEGGYVKPGSGFISGWRSSSDTPEPLKTEPDGELVSVIRVERGSFKSKTAGRMCPMWRLFTDDGRQVNAFDHTDPLRDHKPLLTQAGYMDIFKAMSEGDTQSWTNTPIQARINADGQFWKLISLAKIGELAAPDFEADSDELTPDQQEAAQDAARLLRDKQIVIIDCETTGLDKGIDQPIELAVIDGEGTVLFHKRIKPTVAVTDGAAAIHHIMDEMLANEPTFDDLADEIVMALESKRVLAYNVEFDLAMLHNVGIEIEYSNCIADLYNTFAGETYPSGKIKKHKLVDACAKMQISTDDIAGEHTALGDAQRALRLLKAMAEKAEMPEEPTTGAQSVNRDVNEIPF